MGGKGRKRREKNYRAAHGGHSRLPPPSKSSSVDILPSKLRAIMAFTHSSRPGSAASQSNEKGMEVTISVSIKRKYPLRRCFIYSCASTDPDIDPNKHGMRETILSPILSIQMSWESCNLIERLLNRKETGTPIMCDAETNRNTLSGGDDGVHRRVIALVPDRGNVECTPVRPRGTERVSPSRDSHDETRDSHD
ncbi:hypothetical protein Vadar_032859 [Vaccinium darrowii]|uniref:Uncharacterized protein n=1 Tax=Vaccinium darrowii TaxID=229202 RepID=A0ACB7YA35_9ERIC|nr:hypothetical protein Vadar_032859 [Vaccinium darrowii]